MKINEIQPNQGGIDLEVEVVELSSINNINSKGKNLRLAVAILKDETGTIRMSLWNEAIDSVKEGSLLKITNAYAKEWQGDIQLSLGKFGKIEVLG